MIRALPALWLALAPAAPLAGEADDWAPPDPPAASERADERRAMVREQIGPKVSGREPVRDERVLRAMRVVPRHAFVPPDVREQAYADTALPIGHGQTISQPYIVGAMTARLELTASSRVLEIGTGSGYQAAVLGQITPHVHSIEILDPLAASARRKLEAQGYDHVRVRNADGYFGWPEHAPFDAIIVTAAAGHVPPPLWKQLAPGGRLIIPLGGPFETQRLVLMTKTEEGERRSRALMGVRFVPMTGRIRKEP